MKAIKMLSALLIFSMLFGCSKDDAVEEPARSSENKITSFQFLLSDNPFNENVVGNIDESNKTISFNVPDGAEITALFPDIQVSPNATYTPQGIQSFKEPVIYTVTAEDGTSETYTITAVLSERHILMAIYNANPNNTLDWDLESEDIGNWYGVTLNEDQKVVELDIDSKNLETLPYEIGQFSDLVKLKLTHNELNEIPLEIGQLTNLTRLWLYNNSLNELPIEIGQLNNLTELSISSNNLMAIPSEIGQLTNLTHLFLYNNNLTEIPSEIGQLTNLTRLWLYNNGLTELPNAIGQLTNLTELFISSNNLTAIPSEIGQLTNLTRLFLNNNNLTSIPQVVCDLETNYGTYILLDAGVICE